MATATRQYPDVLVTGPGKRPRVPSWIPRAYATRIATVSEIRLLTRLPGLTVVRAEEPKSVLAERGMLTLLASRLHETPEPAKILFVFRVKVPPPKPESLVRLLTCFDRPVDVEFAWGSKQAASAISEVVAKIWAGARDDAERPWATDPLGALKSVIAATADLRSDSGRLSAHKVASLFGLSLAELGSLIGRSRQTLWKTDDSEAIQASLLPFERIARLRTVLSQTDFRSWLNMSNDQLDERTPIEVIRDGKAEVVADLAADMLTGSPD